MNLLVVSRCFIIIPSCCNLNCIKYPPNKFWILKAELMFLFFILDLKLMGEFKKLFHLVLLCISSGSEKRLLVSEGNVGICIDAGSHHCWDAFVYSEHHCGAGIQVLNLTILNVKEDLTGRCCGLTAVVITLSNLTLPQLFHWTVFWEGLFGKMISQIWNSCYSLWKLSLCYPNNLISGCNKPVSLTTKSPLLKLT